MNHRYLFVVTAGIVTTLIISNISAVKLVQVGPFAFDGGTFLFPLAYIFGDVLTEVYGYKASRKVIWTAFAWLFVATVALQLVVAAPVAEGDFAEPAFSSIIASTPRIVFASLLAYVVGEFINSYVLARLKVLTNGKWLFTRTIGSTVFAQIADTVLFMLVAFTGVLPMDVLWEIVVSAAIFKILIEVLFTPATYAIVAYLKRMEGIDVYDVDTNFNPFRWS